MVHQTLTATQKLSYLHILYIYMWEAQRLVSQWIVWFYEMHRTDINELCSIHSSKNICSDLGITATVTSASTLSLRANWSGCSSKTANG